MGDREVESAGACSRDVLADPSGAAEETVRNVDPPAAAEPGEVSAPPAEAPTIYEMKVPPGEPMSGSAMAVQEPAPPLAAVAAAAPAVAKAPRPSRALRWQRAFVWLPSLLVLPFLVLFLVTSLQRINLPFNIEWNEGQSAEQAIRFTHGLSMYPAPGSANAVPAFRTNQQAAPDASLLSEPWVPYMYTPLYHMILGAIYAVTDGYHLAWGRWISFLSTLATAAGIAFLVRDYAKRWALGVCCGLLYFAYFEPTGFWYDIARNDALAFALGVWGLYFCLRHRAGAGSIAFGMVLLVLGTLAKQPVGLAAIVAGGYLLFTRPKATRMGIVLAAFVSANFLFVFMRTGNEGFLHYAYQNPREHLESWSVVFPDNASPQEFTAESENPFSLRTLAKEYLVKSLKTPPPVWRDAVQHVIVLWAAVWAWLVWCLFAWRKPVGGLYLLIGAILIWSAIAGYAKFGGFINNFLPLFLVSVLLFGLAWNGLRRAVRERWTPIVDGLAALAILLQVLQPWNLLPMNDPGLRWGVMGRYPNHQTRQSLERHFRYLDGATSQAEPASTRWLAQYGRWAHAGLLYIPAAEQPTAESITVHNRLMDWLRVKAQAGEPVWVMHHQLFGFQAGHPVFINIDMDRCAGYAADPVSPLVVGALNARQFKWLVLDMGDLAYEWLPAGTREAIVANYEPVGRHPAYDNLPHADRALMPTTGAEVRPFSLYRLKGFAGDIGRLPAAP